MLISILLILFLFSHIFNNLSSNEFALLLIFNLLIGFVFARITLHLSLNVGLLSQIEDFNLLTPNFLGASNNILFFFLILFSFTSSSS